MCSLQSSPGFLTAVCKCEQIHFPLQKLLGYKRPALVWAGHMEASVFVCCIFLVIHNLFRTDPVQSQNKDSMFSHSNYSLFPRAITQDCKNSYKAFRKKKEEQQPRYLASKSYDFVETCIRETLLDLVLSSHQGISA